MKQLKNKCLFIIPIGLVLTGCTISPTTRYNITWLNYDGTVLKKESYLSGKTPTYSGLTPAKQKDAQYTYTFNNKWLPEIKTVTEDASYYAQFDKTLNKYDITWQNYDNTVLRTDKFEYGSMPYYSGTTPSKPDDQYYSYVFSGWSPQLLQVTGDTTYVAQFTPASRKYTITWTMDDDTLIDTTESIYGAYPTHTNPTKKPADRHYYEFAKWSPDIVPCVGNTTYKATFNSYYIENSTVTFNGTNCMINSKSSFTETITYGGDVSYTIEPLETYSLPSTISVYLFDELVDSSKYTYNSSTGEFSMDNIEGFLKLVVNCE